MHKKHRQTQCAWTIIPRVGPLYLDIILGITVRRPIFPGILVPRTVIPGGPKSRWQTVHTCRNAKLPPQVSHVSHCSVVIGVLDERRSTVSDLLCIVPRLRKSSKSRMKLVLCPCRPCSKEGSGNYWRFSWSSISKSRSPIRLWISDVIEN